MVRAGRMASVRQARTIAVSRGCAALRERGVVCHSEKDHAIAARSVTGLSWNYYALAATRAKHAIHLKNLKTILR